MCDLLNRAGIDMLGVYGWLVCVAGYGRHLMKGSRGID